MNLHLNALVVVGMVCTVTGLTLDSVTTREIEATVINDEFFIIIKDITFEKRLLESNEILFAAYFPGSDEKFIFQLDRSTKRLIVETVQKGLTRSHHVTININSKSSLIRSLIMSVKQTQPGGHVDIYLDCVYQGQINITRSLRDMYAEMSKPELQVFREIHYPLQVDSTQKLSDIFTSMDCSLFDQGVTQTLKPSLKKNSKKCGDLPLIHKLNNETMLIAINNLIQAVQLLKVEIDHNRQDIKSLVRLMDDCNMCKDRPAKNNGPCTNITNPCYEGVQCYNSFGEAECGPCPYGYIGDGRNCSLITSCEDRPCFPGVKCTDTLKGATCGSCPEGYKGNGVNCVRKSACDYNPCHPGVQCLKQKSPPYYRCEPCPPGYTGNGTSCVDIDECYLLDPCDPMVQCTNLSPGFSCGPCPPGYTGSSGVERVDPKDATGHRQKCYDIDECADGRNGGCVPDSQCRNNEGSFHCGGCNIGYDGNQTVGCHRNPAYCPDGTFCDRNATCYDMGKNKYKCKCNIGWAGDGMVCGTDKDLDGYPDYELKCSNSNCRKDNCVTIPNVGQEDADGDGAGDICDPDADNDGILNTAHNCSLVFNVNKTSSDQDVANYLGNACDNCPTISNVNQEDMDKDGLGDVCDPDMDNDDIPNIQDNCPIHPNKDQKDTDGDGIGDVCDNCPKVYNSNQLDSDNDSIGDDCDNCPRVSNLNQLDSDNDSVGDVCDNCPRVSNTNQLDSDNDSIGDDCDNCPKVSNFNQLDSDNDSVGDDCDNCPRVFNTNQLDSDNDSIGDDCDNCPKVSNFNQLDSDNDSVGDDCDNCPRVSNTNQLDSDNDSIGDDCDNCPRVSNSNQLDSDNDSIGDDCDNCPKVSNSNQLDSDNDSIGDICDNCPRVSNTNQLDSDNDSIGDDCDNCPKVSNFNQLDSDNDSVGDDCDNCPRVSNTNQLDSDNDSIGDDCDNCPRVSNSNQLDSDNDSVGDVCDNCPRVSNTNQLDSDNDSIGDDCDNCPRVSNPYQLDSDNDAIGDDCDNCPKVSNSNQLDSDNDLIGDVCDNCPTASNANQLDSDNDMIGDVCDTCPNAVGDVCHTVLDKDRDGVLDRVDNCRSIANSDQLDTDRSGAGDVCDSDDDNDGIDDTRDNCPLVPNPSQRDKNKNGMGDACEDDWDVDGVKNSVDICPNNSLVHSTDFSKFETVVLDPEGRTQPDPIWDFSNNGAKIVQKLNSGPGIAIGAHSFSGVDYEGTVYVDTDQYAAYDYIGFIFSYQNDRRFYTVMWKHTAAPYWVYTPFTAVSEGNIQIKLVNSETGPSQILGSALWHTGNTANQVTLLWKDSRNIGWKHRTTYRWFLLHRPNIGLIRMKIFDGTNLVADSGNIFDTTLTGGRLGLFCFSQEMIIWTDLKYRCNDYVPESVWKELPENLRNKVQIDYLKRSSAFEG